jgi:hypothetical protein
VAGYSNRDAALYILELFAEKHCGPHQILDGGVFAYAFAQPPWRSGYHNIGMDYAVAQKWVEKTKHGVICLQMRDMWRRNLIRFLINATRR